MKKLLIVVDMQNDFITGSLGTAQAEKILPKVKTKVEENRRKGVDVIFTRDTHSADYLETQEGKRLPVEHCIEGSYGHRLADGLCPEGGEVFDKPAFGSLELADGAETVETFDKPTFGSIELADRVKAGGYDEVELCGLCTDICVVSNALILKAALPEARVSVDAACCAGVSEESHRAALLTMKMCQVDVLNE